MAVDGHNRTHIVFLINRGSNLPGDPDSLQAIDTDGNVVKPGRVLISADRIQSRLAELAEEITATYADQAELVIVAVMTGSVMFLADLVRAMRLPMRIGIIVVSSYPGTSRESRGVELVYESHDNLAGKDVLVVDDILDTGETLAAVVESIKSRNARSVRTCVLLEKKTPRDRQIRADFVGFDIEDEFIVGYGLDYDDLYRNYPAIAVLDVKSHADKEM